MGPDVRYLCLAESLAGRAGEAGQRRDTACGLLSVKSGAFRATNGVRSASRENRGKVPPWRGPSEALGLQLVR